MKPKHKRLSLIVAGLLLLGGALALTLAALQENITFFYTPADLAERELRTDQRIRLGGFVLEDSVRRDEDAVNEFVVTDRSREIRVVYRGILPDLFREGQGVVVQGSLRDDGVFVASEVLARHDETYMPRELVEQLRERGIWHKPGDPPSDGTRAQ